MTGAPFPGLNLIVVVAFAVMAVAALMPMFYAFMAARGDRKLGPIIGIIVGVSAGLIIANIIIDAGPANPYLSLSEQEASDNALRAGFAFVGYLVGYFVGAGASLYTSNVRRT